MNVCYNMNIVHSPSGTKEPLGLVRIKSIYIHLSVPCVLHVLQVPLEVMTGATLKPKHGVFVKFETRTWS